MPAAVFARVDARGNLVLPPEQAKKLGLVPGAELRLEPDGPGLRLRPSSAVLKRVYLEITNKCNLTCSTCMRNVWSAEAGSFSFERFERLLADLAAFPELPELFFGGYGEPLAHPQCLAMLARAKGLGFRVSLITNGILLTEDVTRQLVELGLDWLWVSLDGASPEAYADVRIGNALPLVLENLTRLQKQKLQAFGPSPWAGTPKLGIAFVALKRNLRDLPEVIRLGTRLGAVEFSISNVLAHNAELRDENLYMRAMNLVPGQPIRPLVHLPLLEMEAQTAQVLTDLLKEMPRLELTGSLLNQNTDRCPFVERGSLAIRSDGKVSPCLPLLYTHTHFLEDRERTSREYFVGDLDTSDLLSIWNDAQYRALRQRLQAFDFSPCAFCNSCEMATENQEDCFGNVAPTCGGCLWARGLIRCP